MHTIQQLLELYRGYVDQCIAQTPIDGGPGDAIRPVSFDEWHQTIYVPNEASYASPEEPSYGWCWIYGDGENDGNRWIRVGSLDYRGDKPVPAYDEICTLMVRNFDESVAKFPDIVEDREAQARQIVDGLNRFYGYHEVTIVVDGGCVTDVRGLPQEWVYEIEDHDMDQFKDDDDETDTD